MEKKKSSKFVTHVVTSLNTCILLLLHYKKENLVEKKSSKFVTHGIRVEISIESPSNNKHHLKYTFSNITPKLS